jgi:hypothetical protein
MNGLKMCGATDTRVRDVTDGDLLIAHVFDFNIPGPVIFPTPESAEMQCGFGEIAEDRNIAPHVHNIVDRQTRNTSEFIYVIYGRIELVFLNPEGKTIGETVIGPGQGFLQYVGGHKITIAGSTRYFEIKQGPYFGHIKDKTVLQDSAP